MVGVVDILLGIVVVCLPGLGFLVGRLLDADWRCTQQRRFMKKNYIVLNIIEGDGRTYQTKVVNAENDTVLVDNYMWIITKGRIYRKDKPAFGTQLGKKDVTWGNQGAPNVFVGKDDLKPRQFDDQNKSEVKPDEMGATCNAWIVNEKAKLINADKNTRLFIILILVGVAILILMNWGILGNTNDVKDYMTKNGCMPVAGGTGKVQNGSVVINQNAKGGAT